MNSPYFGAQYIRGTSTMTSWFKELYMNLGGWDLQTAMKNMYFMYNS